MCKVQSKRNEKRKNDTGNFAKEQEAEFNSKKSDLEGIQITVLIMKTLRENTSDEKQESVSNIGLDFTVDKDRQNNTGRSEIETECGHNKAKKE